MKAIVIRKYGGVEVLEQADIPKPSVTAGHVVIKVEAAAINPIDWKIRKGEMKMVVRVPFPITMGGEYAGTISEVASDVTRLKYATDNSLGSALSQIGFRIDGAGVSTCAPTTATH